MRKRKPLFEWQIEEKPQDQRNTSWLPPIDATATSPETHRHPYRRTIQGGALALLLVLASVGGWLWQKAQAGLDEIDEELSGAVYLELASAAPTSAPPAGTITNDPAVATWETQLQRERETLHKALSPEISETLLRTEVETTYLQGDLAAANFVTTAGDGTQAYRQTRFYHYTTGGWQRTAPVAGLWGAPRRLESSHFIYHFRQNDAEVVAAVAPAIDALFTELQHNFALAPDTKKLVIEVTVEQTTGAMLTPKWEYEPLLVPSSALYLAPVDLNGSALLAQSIALPLLEYMGERAIDEHAVPPRWQSMLRGLQLWQLWHSEMPLAIWQQELVKWLYIEAPDALLAQQSMLPSRYTELCAMHRLWILSPVTIGVPLECAPMDAIAWSPGRMPMYAPPMRLHQISIPLANWEVPYYGHANDPYHSSEAVVIGNLIEYARLTYGDAQVPLLLASLAQYDTWDTLIPAVYGVSSAEFEKGWQMYMAKEYGVQP